MRVAIVSAELSPFVGGGIAASVRATAQVLAGAGHHVDIFTRASFRPTAIERIDDIVAFRHPNITWHWVAEPADDTKTWHFEMSERFEAALHAAYPSAVPDLIEIQDYQGLGAHIAASRGGGKFRGTLVAVRLHSSLEQVGFLDDTPVDAMIAELERISLAASDVMLAPSESVFEFYRSFYGATDLPSSVVLWPGFLFDDAPGLLPASSPTPELRLLLLGRQQRFKGSDRLVSAVVQSPDLPVTLTLVGGDTPTGPAGSMRSHLEALSADDSRVSITGPVARSQIAAFLSDADALVVSSTWETWGNVGLEALAAARPLIVTPCASLPTMAGDGRFGIVADGFEVDDLKRALRRAVDERARLRALCGDPALPAHLRALTDEGRVAAGYEQIAARTPSAAEHEFSSWRLRVAPAKR